MRYIGKGSRMFTNSYKLRKLYTSLPSTGQQSRRRAANKEESSALPCDKPRREDERRRTRSLLSGLRRGVYF